MSKFSSFKDQQLITESWRAFMVEQQPVGVTPRQPQQAQQAQAEPELDVRKPVDIKRMLATKATQKSGSPGPDETTKQNIKNNKQVLMSGRVAAQPIQAAQILLQLFNQLSPEDQAEASKVAQRLLQQTPQQPTKTQKTQAQQQPPVQKEGVIDQADQAIGMAALSALSKLGSGDAGKGVQILGAGAFITAIGLGLYQIANGDAITGGAVLVKALANNIEKLYNSNNPTDLEKILSTIGDALTPGKREDETIYEGAHLDDGTLVCEACLEELLESQRTIIQEAKYQGRTVTLNKPTKGDVKKFKVYVKDPSTGNVKKVNFGDPNMKIKKNIPARRKSFRARHNCANPGPKTKARYWSCKKW